MSNEDLYKKAIENKISYVEKLIEEAIEKGNTTVSIYGKLPEEVITHFENLNFEVEIEKYYTNVKIKKPQKNLWKIQQENLLNYYIKRIENSIPFFLKGHKEYTILNFNKAELTKENINKLKEIFPELNIVFHENTKICVSIKYPE